eukprot:UN07574
MTLAIMDGVNNVEREKQGEIFDQDDDDYDVEDDPDPIPVKVNMGETVGNLDGVSAGTNNMINKTLGMVGNMTGATGSVAALDNATAPTAGSSSTAGALSEFNMTGMGGGEG